MDDILEIFAEVILEFLFQGLPDGAEQEDLITADSKQIELHSA